MKGSICLAIVLQLALLILLGSKSQRSVAQSSGGSSSEKGDRGLFGKPKPKPHQYAHPYYADGSGYVYASPAGSSHNGNGNVGGMNGYQKLPKHQQTATSYPGIMAAYVTEKVAHRTAKIVSSATPGVKPATYVKVKEGVHKIAGKLGIKKPPSSIELHYQDRGGANAAPSRSP